jgi:hypothetical protein
MGMFRDSGSAEIDIIKEMAEGLGSTGLRLEDLLEKANACRENVLSLVQLFHEAPRNKSEVNDSIKEYNALVDKAEDVLRWLLIQREACGFRTHRDVHVHYPIPPKIKLLT